MPKISLMMLMVMRTDASVKMTAAMMLMLMLMLMLMRMMMTTMMMLTMMTMMMTTVIVMLKTMTMTGMLALLINCCCKLLRLQEEFSLGPQSYSKCAQLSLCFLMLLLLLVVVLLLLLPRLRRPFCCGPSTSYTRPTFNSESVPLWHLAFLIVAPTINQGLNN